ncbi:MAG: CHASE2 domain-containing protein [Pseudomonadota bacterium]
MVDEWMRNKRIDEANARMMAEQAVIKMSSKIDWQMKEESKAGLVEAILKSGDAQTLMFHRVPFRPAPPRWSMSGMMTRAALALNCKFKHTPALKGKEAAERLTATHYTVRRSGAVGLTIALLIALVVGIIEFGEPLELVLQMGRDAVRRTAASGDIVVIAKDERSAKLFGGLPWQRRYDAQLVDTLRTMGAQAIVYEQVMADSQNPEDDQALAAAFDRAYGKVWLGALAENNRITGGQDIVLPTPTLRSRTKQAHSMFRYNIIGNVSDISTFEKIGGKTYLSQSVVLAGLKPEARSFKPDYAIDYQSIPKIAAIDVIFGMVDSSAIAGKRVIISVVSDSGAMRYPISGQGKAALSYSFVIAAETMKNGPAKELGYLIPLLLCALIGIACVLRSARWQRSAILVAGAVGLVMLVLVADRLKLHFEIVPALVALSIFGIRDVLRGNVIAAMTTNAVSGLPNLAHLPFVKGAEKSVVVAVKVERFASLVSDMTLPDHKELVESIAARINIIAPDCVVHDGDDGLYVILITPDSVVEVDLVVEQLHALFTEKVVSLDSILKIYVSIGMNDDPNLRFGERVAVATDRALHSAFVTLRQVV